MEIRNRIPDIRILQTHILQDYFRMALTANFIDDTWKPILREEIQRNVDGNSQYKKNYLGAWNKMQLKGMDNYSFDDMDTSIIITIINHYKDIRLNCCGFYSTNQYLVHLQDDRNIDAHTTGNETDAELLRWAHGSLHNISKFIVSVASADIKNSKVSDDEKYSYARKYQAEIEALYVKFENDYNEAHAAEEIEQSIIRNIERIKTSNDPQRTYIEIEGQYLNKRDNEGKVDLVLFKRFMQTAADAGVVWACSLIGDLYFKGSMTDVDYVKAAEYYEKGFSQLMPPQKINLASIYLNDLCSSSHTKEEGMTILKSCESPRHEIISNISKEGYKFYSLKRNKHNS